MQKPKSESIEYLVAESRDKHSEKRFTVPGKKMFPKTQNKSNKVEQEHTQSNRFEVPNNFRLKYIMEL